MKPIFIYSDTILNMLSWFMRVGGISLFPIVILREKHKDPVHQSAFIASQRIHTHETIHFQQQLEMLVIFFYIWYAIEFVIRLIQFKSFKKAYRNLLHEKEAYRNESDFRYLQKRKRYAWLRGTKNM